MEGGAKSLQEVVADKVLLIPGADPLGLPPALAMALAASRTVRRTRSIGTSQGCLPQWR